MVTVDAVLTQLLNGVVFGSVLALIAMGLSIIFGLLGIVNFSHGAFYALGVYVGITSMNIVGGEMAFFAAILLVPLVIGVVGAAVEMTIIRPIYDREGLLAPLLLTFGLMLVLHAVIKLVWGVSGQSLSSPPLLSDTLIIGPVTYPSYRLFVAVMMMIIAALVWVFLNYTDLGMIVRAATENRSMVKCLGIDINRVYTLVFGIGTALAGLAGLLHAPMVSIFPTMGEDILIISFVVVVIGGMNSFKGSIAAGILVGTISSLSFLVWPPMTNIIIFVFMAIFLIIRPYGLFGQALGGIEQGH